MKNNQPILKRLGFNENRKARNFLLKPGLQLKLPFYFLLLSLGFIFTTMLFAKLYFEQTYITLAGIPRNQNTYRQLLPSRSMISSHCR